MAEVYHFVAAGVQNRSSRHAAAGRGTEVMRKGRVPRAEHFAREWHSVRRAGKPLGPAGGLLPKTIKGRGGPQSLENAWNQILQKIQRQIPSRRPGRCCEPLRIGGGLLARLCCLQVTN